VSRYILTRYKIRIIGKFIGIIALTWRQDIS